MCEITIKHKSIVISLVAISLFALVLRLYHLDWQCYAADEFVTHNVAGWTTQKIFFWSLGHDYNPPLYYLFAHWISIVFGEVSAFTIRFSAFILGVALIPTIYYAGKEMVNKTTGLLASSISAFLFPYVYYSQNARFYTLVMLVFVMYILMFSRVFNGDTKKKTILLLSLFAALCLWSHFYSIIPISISIVILGLKYRKMLFWVPLLGVLLCFPFYRYIETVVGHFENVFAKVHDTWWLGPLDIAVLIPNELFCWSWLLVIPLCGFSLLKYKNPLHIRLVVISAITALSCVPMTYLTAMSPRYALLVSPVILLVSLYPLSIIIDNQKSSDKKLALFFVIVFIFFLFNFGSLLSWYTFNICPFVKGNTVF